MTSVLVYGAYGHTGRFVVAELRARGFEPILSGRDAARLPGGRPASVDDPASLDRALAGVAAVINTAGPFAETATPVIEAAQRAGVPYVDVAAELEANLDTFARFADADTVVVPAMAFYGGLGDLLATAAMGDWTGADEIHVAYGLSGWHPTAEHSPRAASPARGAAASASGSRTVAWSTTTTRCRSCRGRSPSRWARSRCSASSRWPTS